MTTYKFDGLCHSPGFAEVEAGSRKEALLLALDGKYIRMEPEGKPGDFTINDSDWDDVDVGQSPEDFAESGSYPSNKTVVIEVDGGAASVAHSPDGIRVVIVDFDVNPRADWGYDKDDPSRIVVSLDPSAGKLDLPE